MEVRLDKRYPVAASPAACWAVLGDIRAVAACMPGAQITEQVDATHFKGTVRSKVGPAVMSFGGDIELQGRDEAAQALKMLGKGADKSGSSASMQLTAHLEPGTPDGTVLVGVATIVVSGKLAQFGSRLLVPVSDAMLAQFADNFRAAAAKAAAGLVDAPPAREPLPSATATAGAGPDLPPVRGAAADLMPAPLPQPSFEPAAAPSAPAAALAPAPAAPAEAKELNALALLWTVFKGWLAGLFGRKP